MPGMIVDPGQAFDDQRDPGQRPEGGAEPMGLRAPSVRRPP